MDWGNAIVRGIARSPSGVVTNLELELHLQGDFKTTEKKITWLSAPVEKLVPVTLLDYDYLITKRKLEDTDDIASVGNRNTEFKVEALADANVLNLKKRDIIQFERKGYFIVDAINGEAGGKTLDLIRIPDGRAAGLALKSEAKSVTAPTPAKADLSSDIKMYKLDPIQKDVKFTVETSMYKTQSMYEV